MPGKRGLVSKVKTKFKWKPQSCREHQRGCCQRASEDGGQDPLVLHLAARAASALGSHLPCFLFSLAPGLAGTFTF